MLKKFIGIVFILMILNITTTTKALDIDGEYLDDYNTILEESKADSLFDYLSVQTENILEDIGIERVDSDSLINLSFSEIWNSLYTNAKDSFYTPIKIFINILAVILISSMLNSLQSNTNIKTTTQAFSMVSVLCISGILIPNIITLINSTKQIMEQISKFMLGFIPIFTAIISVSGKPISAFTYSGFLLGIIELISFLISYAIFPMIGIYFAFACVGTATGIGNLNTVSKSIRGIVLWGLGLFLTIFVGMLTIKSFVSSSADTVTMRAGKYVVGSFVPIVGSILSETLGVLQSSIELIKSSIGVFGIVAIIITILPTLISLIGISISIKISKIVSDIFSNNKISEFLDSANFVLNLLIAVIACYSMMLIVSTSLMLVLGFDK